MVLRPPPSLSTGSAPPLTQAQDRLIVALDVTTAAEAYGLVERLEGTCRWFKVGLELYLSAGSSIVESLNNQGYSVFLDLKLHDIPNTVAGAVRAVARSGARLLTIHSSGGPGMIAAAAEAAAGIEGAPRILAVTVLTSMDQAQLEFIGLSISPAQQALQLARISQLNGVDGIVCSAQEVSAMRALMGPDAVLVTPGIRLADGDLGDQKRVATPSAALVSGADYLVVGRPISKAADPARAAAQFLEEMALATQPPNRERPHQ